MKQLINIIVPACLLCFLCSVLPGCFITNELINSCKDFDPRVQTYHAAYMHKGDIVLEYTVQDQSNRKRFADRYWATLHPDKMADGYVKGDYSIHRKPLPDRMKKKITPVPIVDLRKQLPDDDNGLIKYEAIYAFLEQQPIDTLPQVFVCMDRGIQLYVRYIDPDSGKIKIYTHEPYEIFIHSSRYPIFLALLPFAVVGDIVTFPVACTVVLLYVPRWPM
ncbi:MAG: hypothetical protein PHT43_07620 [Anaerolineaceae bacterium]|nr:hypothetical protein [Anaerolineaceae bacterium]